MASTCLEAGKEKGAWKEGWQRAGRGWKGKWDKGCAPAQSSEPPSSAFLLTPTLPNAKGNIKSEYQELVKVFRSKVCTTFDIYICNI